MSWQQFSVDLEEGACEGAFAAPIWTLNIAQGHNASRAYARKKKNMCPSWTSRLASKQRLDQRTHRPCDLYQASASSSDVRGAASSCPR